MPPTGYTWPLTPTAPLSGAPTPPLPPPYKAMEDALAAWLVGSTGLPTNRIINRNAKVSQPPLPYLEYVLPFGRTIELDETRFGYDVSAPAGKQVRYIVRGQRESVVTVHAYSLATVGDQGPAQGSLTIYTARHYLDMARSSLGFPYWQDSLYQAGLVFINEENVQDLTLPRGPIGQGHAVMDLRFHFNVYAIDGIGSIDTVTLPVGYFIGG